MKKAIHLLRETGINVDDNGNILSDISEFFEGMRLIEMLEENTIDEQNECCYTIINNKVEKIDI